MSLLVSQNDFPIFNFDLTFNRGTVTDPQGLEGCARLLAKMMMRGTENRTYLELVNEFENLGSTLYGYADHSWLSFSGDCIKRNGEQYIALLCDVLRNKQFTPEMLTQLKEETVSQLELARNSDEEVVRHFFEQFINRGHAYARLAVGTKESVNRIEVAHLSQAYDSLLGNDELILGFSGDVNQTDADNWENQIRESLAPNRNSSELKEYSKPEFKGLEILVVDKPERAQTQIMLGCPTLAVNHPDVLAMQVANNAFGGTYMSTLNDEIRIKRGWSYGAYSGYTLDKEAGSFYIWTFPEKKDCVDCVKLVWELYGKFVEENVSEALHEKSKQYLINSFPFKLETASRRLSQLIKIDLLGLPKNNLETFTDRVQKINYSDSKAAHQKHLQSQNAGLVVVATAKDVVPQLEAWDAVSKVTVIDYRSEYA
jgi:zinc protease